MSYHCAIGQTRYTFQDLKTLMAKATPLRSGDCLAGIAAENASERVAAQRGLAEVPLKRFLNEALIPYEQDEVTRLILDSHVAEAFAPVSHLMVGGFSQLAAVRPGQHRRLACAGAGADTGDGRRRCQDHVGTGSDPGGAENRGGDPLQEYPRPAWTHVHTTAAQPPHRRPGRGGGQPAGQRIGAAGALCPSSEQTLR